MEKTAPKTSEHHRGSRYFEGAAFLGLLCVAAASAISNPVVTTVLVAGGIAAAFTWDRPDLGLWAIVVLTPLETFLGIDFVVTKAVKLGLVAFVACSLLARRSVQLSQRKNEFKDPYRVPLYLLVATGFCATLLASSPIRSAIGLGTLCLFVIYFISLQRSNVLVSLAPRLLRTIAILSIPIAALALLQLTQGYGGILGSHEQQATEEELRTLWPSIERASATFNGPNAAGAFLAIAALIAFVHAVLFQKHRIRYSVVAAVGVLGVLATFSRGSLLGLFCGLGFALWRLGYCDFRWRSVVAVSLILISLGTSFFSQTVRDFLRLGPDLISTSATRFDAWQATFSIVRRHPITGIGFYEFQSISQGIEGVSDTTLHPHNGFLKALVEQGLFGGLAYLLLLLSFVKTAIKTLRFPESPEDRWILASIGCIGACLFTQELFDAGYTVGGSSMAILFVTFLALQVSTLRRLAFKEIAPVS